MVERPCRSSAIASVSPTRPPPRMMTSARSIGASLDLSPRAANRTGRAKMRRQARANRRPALQRCNAWRLTRDSREAHLGLREHLGHEDGGNDGAKSRQRSARAVAGRAPPGGEALGHPARRPRARFGLGVRAAGADQLPAERSLAQHRGVRAGPQLDGQRRRLDVGFPAHAARPPDRAAAAADPPRRPEAGARRRAGPLGPLDAAHLRRHRADRHRRLADDRRRGQRPAGGMGRRDRPRFRAAGRSRPRGARQSGHRPAVPDRGRRPGFGRRPRFLPRRPRPHRRGAPLARLAAPARRLRPGRAAARARRPARPARRWWRRPSRARR